MEDAAAKLARIRARMEAAAKRSGRDATSVRLIAVTKYASLDAVHALYGAGQRDFAENRVPALVERIAALPPDARWHYIGNIQSNKLRALTETGALVHSFDRPDLAAKWGTTPVLLQVDYAGLDHRNGIPSDEVAAALATLERHGVPCVGLSTLAPRERDAREVFRHLRALRDEHAPTWPALQELSMGMSSDFEAAIEEGATMVRIGRALTS